MLNNTEILKVAEVVSQEKGIEMDIVMEALEESFEIIGIANKGRPLDSCSRLYIMMRILIEAWRKQQGLTVNKTKYFWLFSPTQLLTQGQWWSIFLKTKRAIREYGTFL